MLNDSIFVPLNVDFDDGRVRLYFIKGLAGDCDAFFWQCVFIIAYGTVPTLLFAIEGADLYMAAAV